MEKNQKKFMQQAIKEALKGMKNNEGGPFGAVIVKHNKILARAHNEVIGSKNPTAHAEILAISRASKKLNRFDLSDCELYSTCEPCPMCLGAIYWARIKKLYFGCTSEDTEKIGFADKAIYDIFKGKVKKLPCSCYQIERETCLSLFNTWEKKENKIQY